MQSKKYSQKHKPDTNEKGATLEVYANFVGDVLFEKGNRTLDDLIKGVDKRSKPRFIQALLDIITWLKEKFKGNKQLTFELVRLETKYKRALREAQKAWEQKVADNKKATDEGGEQYSLDSKNGRRYNKPIKVPGVVYKRISSVRMDRYSHLDDADIPLNDSVSIGAQRVNTAITYHFYNIDRDNFTVYKKTKTSPKKGSEDYDINRRIDRAIAQNSDNKSGDNRQDISTVFGNLPSDGRGVSVRNRRTEQDKKSEPHGRDSNNSRTSG